MRYSHSAIARTSAVDDHRGHADTDHAVSSGGALYSSVGHAGASGYLAAMALVGMAPDGMRVTALVLNVLVATIGTVSYMRAGHSIAARFTPSPSCRFRPPSAASFICRRQFTKRPWGSPCLSRRLSLGVRRATLQLTKPAMAAHRECRLRRVSWSAALLVCCQA